MQEALTRRSSWLTLVARCECLKRHGVGDGVGERESEVGADFGSLVSPRSGFHFECFFAPRGGLAEFHLG